MPFVNFEIQKKNTNVNNANGKFSFIANTEKSSIKINNVDKNNKTKIFVSKVIVSKSCKTMIKKNITKMKYGKKLILNIKMYKYITPVKISMKK